MRHLKHTFKIGRTGSHRRAMLANMAIGLITAGEIQTSLVRAKELRRFVERLVTLGKKGDLHNRRIALARVGGGRTGETAIKQLFDVVAPAYNARNGGYTRIIKLGERRGDACQMCKMQLIGFEKVITAKADKAEAKAEVKAEKEAVANA